MSESRSPVAVDAHETHGRAWGPERYGPGATGLLDLVHVRFLMADDRRTSAEAASEARTDDEASSDEDRGRFDRVVDVVFELLDLF